MIAVEVCQWLHGQGVVSFAGAGITGNAFVENLPDAPDECVMVRETGGIQAHTYEPLDRPTVQVITRCAGDSPTWAESKAQAVYNAMCGLARERLVAPTGTYVIHCAPVQSSPAYIGRDENGRHMYSMNYQLHVYNASR